MKMTFTMIIRFVGFKVLEGVLFKGHVAVVANGIEKKGIVYIN